MIRNFKKLKMLCLVLLMALLITSTLGQVVNAGTSPTEHCFGVNHPAFSYTDHEGGWSVSALNTLSNASNIHNALDNNGYYNQYYFSNNSATSVGNSIGQDAIFYINSHGNAGIVCCPYYDSGTSSWKMTYLSATNTQSDSIAVSLNSLYSGTTDKLKKVRFAYFGSCYSANTATTNAGWGNLLSTCNSLGVDCSLGFTNTITTNRHIYFSERMIIYYGMDSNNTVSACASSAKADTYSTYGDYGGVDSYSFSGSSSIKLVPAAYGTY